MYVCMCVCLLCVHAQKGSLLPHWWPVDSLPSPVQLGHDDVLHLTGAGLSREVDHVGKVELLLDPVHQLVLDVDRLPSASVAHKEDCVGVLHHQVHQVGVPGDRGCGARG